MELVIEADFLLGTCTATLTPASRVADWPIQPDRLFSALVASWALNGHSNTGRDTLTWLESLPAPTLMASCARHRTVVDQYVPVNDQQTSERLSAKTAEHIPRVLPEHRTLQPRNFPVAVPDDSRLFFIWDQNHIKSELLEALQTLVQNVTCLGHSSSLVACRLQAIAAVEELAEKTQMTYQPATHWVYPGRLEELNQAFTKGLRPLATSKASPSTHKNTHKALEHTVYGNQWTVLECADGNRPSLVAASRVAETLRRAILSVSASLLPEVISGHGADGKATHNPHMAVLTLPFVGPSYADGTIHGIAIVLPWALDKQFQNALSGASGDAEMRAIEVRQTLSAALDSLQANSDTNSAIKLHAKGFPPFAFTRSPRALKTLQPWRWCKPSTRWCTVTPIVLDRHIKGRGWSRAQPNANVRSEEVSNLIEQACSNIGLPRPCSIETARVPFIRGSDKILTTGPLSARWQVPERYRTRTLVHAEIRFDERVEGPVLLGAARHYGLGLCAPMASRGA